MAANPIKDALSKLDVSNNAHWTEDGAPRLDVLKKILGGSVKRDEVASAWPGFNREMAKQGVSPAAPTPEVQPTPPPADTPSEVRANGPVAEDNDEDSLTVSTQDIPEGPDLSALKAEHAAATAQLQQLRIDRDEVSRKIDAQEREVDRLADLQRRNAPKENPITAWLANEQKLREERGAARATLGALGIDPKKLVAAVQSAPIDRAMARQRSRGVARPVVPVTK